MAEAVLNWPEIMAAIKAELEAVENSANAPAFQLVVMGEPIGAVLGGPHCYAWYLGRTNAREGEKTLRNIMYAARIQIMALWPRQDISTVETWEADIATVDTNIRRAFRANSTINSNVTDLDITDSQVDYGDLPAAEGRRMLYRVLQFELRLDNLEGEAISA